MADDEEEAAAEKQPSVRDSQEVIDQQEETEAEDEVKPDLQGLEASEPVATDVQQLDQDREADQELQPEDAAAVEDKEEKVGEQEEIPKEEKEEKAERAEDEDLAADEECVEHEYIHEGEEAAMETLEDSLPQAPVVGDEQVQVEAVEADEMLDIDEERLEVTSPDSLVISVDLEPAEEQDKLATDQGELTVSEEGRMQRMELIEKYYDAVAKRNKLQSQNFIVQNKLFDYFRRKKSDEVVDPDKNVSEYEQRYLKLMAQMEDLRKLDSIKRDNYHVVIQETKERCMEKKSRADSERKHFIELKQNVALRAINSQTGQPLPATDIEQYVDSELRKEQEVVQMRLENIRLKNSMKKNEQQIKLKEQVSEGLHLIDFEQLKIENQTYNEKIEERNEELLKFRKKITSTVQILTHLKEKLQFVQAENLVKSNDLKVIDATLAQSRDILSRTKQARDSLKIDNNKLRQKCGFLGNESLLRDFEEQKDENIELQSRLDQLKMKHSELTLHCNHVRQKVEQARHSLA